MKKKIFIIVFIFIFLFCFILFMIINSDNENSVVKGEIVEEKKVKEKRKFSTKGYDHINEFLREDTVLETKINYVYEYKEKNGFYEEDNKTYYYVNNEKIKGVKKVDDIRYYFDFETGELMDKDILSVIDISSWQGDIDFEKVKESDLVDAVIIRLGYGSFDGEECTLDDKFERNINELKRLDIPYGIYFYGYAKNEELSKLEASYVSEMIKKYDLALSLPIFYDAEHQIYNDVTFNKNLYRKIINSFIKEMNKNGFDNIGVYSYLNMFINGGLSTLKNSIPKWIAQYYYRCEYEKDYIGWQYTNNETIPGIDGKVDMNIFKK